MEIEAFIYRIIENRTMDLTNYVDKIFKRNQQVSFEEYSMFDDMEVIAIINTCGVMKDALDARAHCLVCLNPSTEKAKNFYILYVSLVILDACFCSDECLSLYCLQKGKTVMKFVEDKDDKKTGSF